MQNSKCKTTGPASAHTHGFVHAAASFCILRSAFCVADLFLDRRLLDVLSVAGERLVPGRDRLGPPTAFGLQIAEVILNLRVLGQLLRRRRQVFLGVVEIALAEVRPTETVE